VKRRAIVLVLAAFLLSVWVAVPADAALPLGPRLAISVSGDGPGGGEDGFSKVITTGPAGEDPQTLLEGRVGGLSWSAGADRLAFAAVGVESTADGPYGTGWPVVGLATSGIATPRVYPRAFLNGGYPVLAPDGRTVVFSRLKLVKTLPGRESYLFKSALWSLNAERGSVKRLTRWRLAAFVDPVAFSPDGSSIVTELLDRRGRRIVAIDPDGGRSRRLARLALDAQEPAYSPDGARLAYVRDKTKRFDLHRPDRPISELWVANADGSGARRVLRVKGYVGYPTWDPSGSRLAFTRNPAAEATGALEAEPGNRAMAINADGTCLTRVFTDPGLILHEVAWVPGAGREAGPISC
jgi:Tol biopolymer transport system component